MKLNRYSLEGNLSRFASLLQESFFAEETARKNGWLQKIDPRIKLLGLFFLLLCSSFSTNWKAILLIYLFALIVAAGSKLFSHFFLRKLWLLIPLYTLVIAMPSLFLVPGEPLVQFGGITITRQGFTAAAFLVLRVGVAVSLMLLLILSTSWSSLLKALRALFIPKIVVLMMLMTYRYIYLLLHVAINLFLAKKSRRLGPEDWRSSRKWLEATLGGLVGKSVHTSHDVHLAMISRGFRGEPQILHRFSFQLRDALWFALFLVTGIAAITLP